MNKLLGALCVVCLLLLPHFMVFVIAGEPFSWQAACAVARVMGLALVTAVITAGLTFTAFTCFSRR